MTEHPTTGTDLYKGSAGRSTSANKPIGSSPNRARPTNSRYRKNPKGSRAAGNGARPEGRPIRPYSNRPRYQPKRKGYPKSKSVAQGKNYLDYELLAQEYLETLAEYEAEPINASEIKKLTIAQIVELTKEMGDQNLSHLRKSDIIVSFLKFKESKGIPIIGGGVLEIMREGYGLLRSPEASYLTSSDDITVPVYWIKKYSLQTGDHLFGAIRPPNDREQTFTLVRVDRINDDEAEKIHKRTLFSNLTPLHPDEHLRLENGDGSDDDVTARIVDIISPVGKGQRGLLVASPKAGKTVILQKLARRISQNYPDIHVIVLLIDERPEEVTEMQRLVTNGEVVSSTFDEPASRHVQVAQMVIEKAKRLVECRKDVVIFLDSITRLARAHNTVAPASGRILSGGVDSNALHRPKRFFGAARNVEEGGSLTIVATALVETGSKMDEVIYEEFKGTGNMELHLERKIAEKRVYPAISIDRSGTRREELLLTPDALKKVRILRKVMHEMDSCASIEFLINKIQHTESNEDFFESMTRG